MVISPNIRTFLWNEFWSGYGEMTDEGYIRLRMNIFKICSLENLVFLYLKFVCLMVVKFHIGIPSIRGEV